jgi:hypothetical protein
VAVLNVFHPAVCMREVFEASKKAKAGGAKSNVDVDVDEGRHKSEKSQPTDNSKTVFE